MPDFSSHIRGFAAGDNLEVHRYISNLPIASVVSQAWLTLKRSIKDPDTAAIAQLVITVTLSAMGQIVNSGDGQGNCEIKFFLTPAITTLLSRVPPCVYDIQLRTVDSLTYTPEIGDIQAEAQVTLS